jgi:endonuclease YncB( thermonuclease family)
MAAAKKAPSNLVFGRNVTMEPIEQDRYDWLVAALAAGSTSMPRWSSRAMVYRRFANDPHCTYES